MKNSVKIWPKLDDITQALIPYSKTNLNTDNILNLDFSNVRSVKSSGATLTLVKLIKIIKENKNGRWNVILPENSNVKDCLETTGFYSVISKNIPNKDLFWKSLENKEKKSFTHQTKQNINITSFPIYHLDYNNGKYREKVEEFSDWLIETMYGFCKRYDFRFNILAKLLKEIAKNSEDHTKDNAFFGIDLLENNNSNKAEIVFSFCDLGKGIHENIKEHRKKATKKYGIVDSYHQAFKPGFTTSGNTNNKGIGMSMILDCVQILDMELSIFDARSRGFIPSEYTHEEIRRNFWNTGNKVGFNYYGILNIAKLGV